MAILTHFNPETKVVQTETVHPQQTSKNDKIANVVAIVMAGLVTAAVAVGIAATITVLSAALVMSAKVIGIIAGVILLSFLLAKLAKLIAPHLPAPLAKAANVVHCFVTEIFTLIRFSCLYFFKTAKNNPTAESIKNIEDFENKKIALLVHGLYHNSSAWHDWIGQLEAEGFVVFTVDLGNYFASIDTHCQTVKDEIAKIKEITKKEELFLVGHSMGGMISSRVALDQDENSPMKIKKVTTIGSPLRGTPMAYVGIGAGAKDMRPGSEFTTKLIEDLKANDEKLAGERVEFFNIGTKTDELVIGISQSVPEELNNSQKLVLDDLGHAGILYDQTIIEQSIKFNKK